MRRGQIQRQLRGVLPLRRPRDLVLMYHRVVTAPRDPLRLNVTPEHFAEQAQVLADLPMPVVPLEGLLAPAPGPRIAITFDDGYLDNFDVAAPILVSLGLPATYFVTTGALDEGAEEFWWDRIEHLLFDEGQQLPHLRLDLGARVLELDLSDLVARERAFLVCNDAVALARPPAADRLVAALAEALGRTTEPCARHARISRDRLRSVARNPLVSVGSHTRDHAALRNLDDAAAREQIVGTRRALADVLDSPPAFLAYPFGGRLAVGSRDVALAKEAGYIAACVTRPDTKRRGSDPHRIPRWSVPDVGGPTFRALVTAFASR